MYANESKGERYPTVRRYRPTSNNIGCGTRQNDYEVMFDGPSVYPEYLSDHNVLVCPSDSDGGDIALGQWNENNDPDQPINPCTFNAHSYNYFGYAIENKYWLIDPTQENLQGQTPPYNVATFVEPNFYSRFATFVLVDIPVNWAQNGDGSVFDNDLPIPNTPYTIYRLREGIERFLITDINNPAASARAQSDTWIYMDDINSANPDFMNHIPGGGNVLYLDGHVSFLRYKTVTPFSVGWAVILGELRGAV
jgi:prepilin-type processing-associated H-X9-DG protein